MLTLMGIRHFHSGKKKNYLGLETDSGIEVLAPVLMAYKVLDELPEFRNNSFNLLN